MNAACPKRRALRWPAFSLNHGKILRIDPNASFEQVFVLPLRKKPKHIGKPPIHDLGPQQLKTVILESYTGGKALLRLGGFLFGFEHLLEHMAVSGLPALLRYNLEMLSPIAVAADGQEHLGLLVQLLVFQDVSPAPGVTATELLPFAVMRD